MHRNSTVDERVQAGRMCIAPPPSGTSRTRYRPQGFRTGSGAHWRPGRCDARNGGACLHDPDPTWAAPVGVTCFGRVSRLAPGYRFRPASERPRSVLRWIGPVGGRLAGGRRFQLCTNGETGSSPPICRACTTIAAGRLLIMFVVHARQTGLRGPPYHPDRRFPAMTPRHG